MLRGPQGTLYGGSSEGGTLRFITPTPSLTTYSGSARVGWSTMAGGGMGNEEGLALGGPIVQDKLGFRIAGFRQDRPGWVDTYSEYDGHQFASDVNWGEDYSLRGALLWQVTPSFKATVSVFHQIELRPRQLRRPCRTIVAGDSTHPGRGTLVQRTASSTAWPSRSRPRSIARLHRARSTAWLGNAPATAPPTAATCPRPRSSTCLRRAGRSSPSPA